MESEQAVVAERLQGGKDAGVRSRHEASGVASGPATDRSAHKDSGTAKKKSWWKGGGGNKGKRRGGAAAAAPPSPLAPPSFSAGTRSRSRRLVVSGGGDSSANISFSAGARSSGGSGGGEGGRVCGTVPILASPDQRGSGHQCTKLYLWGIQVLRRAASSKGAGCCVDLRSVR